MTISSGSILIVDDNSANLYVKCRMLSQAGWTVFEATDGTTGLDIFSKTPELDLAVVDIHMPDMLGFDVCRQMKSKRPEIPVLLTSATFVGPKDRTFALDEGADAYLTEPTEDIVFLSQVRALLRTRVAERRLRESEARLHLSLERYRGVYDNAGTGIAIFALNGNLLDCNPAYSRVFQFTESELKQMSHTEIVHPEDRQAHLAETGKLLAGEISFFEIFNRCLRSDGETVWVHKFVSMLRDPSGKPTNTVELVTDLTYRKLQEDHIKDLLREVTHRSKNMLAIIQVIARQTVAYSGQDFARRFSERVQALAASHDLLVNSAWRSVDLRDLAISQLAHFSDLLGTRIVARGPKISVSAPTAQSIGMALHELATNAGKYGALSNATGGVEISWGLFGHGDESSRFEISWHEFGGPKVAPPQRKGFGTVLTGATLEVSLNATVVHEFAPDGIYWKLSCPAKNVVDVKAT